MQATYKGNDGIVVIDADRCIGCKYCIAACPYGARSADEGSSYGVARCRRPIRRRRPSTAWSAARAGSTSSASRHGAQVRVLRASPCLGRGAGVLRDVHRRRAVFLGDLNDPESKVAQLAASPRAFRLREELGTNPSCLRIRNDRGEGYGI